MQRALMMENCAGAKTMLVLSVSMVENCAGTKCVDGRELCWCNVR